MDILKLLLIAHLIGDFFLQPVKLVEQKKNSIKGLIIHTLIYTLMIVLVLLLFGNIWEIIFWTLFILVSHSLIDYFRIKFTKKFNNNDFSFWSFIIDQFIHVLLLVTISLVIKSNLNSIGYVVYNITFLKEIGSYLRVLGMNGVGRSLLRSMEEHASLPVLTKPAHIRSFSPTAQRLFDWETRATDFYGFCLPQLPPCGVEWIRGPVIL